MEEENEEKSFDESETSIQIKFRQFLNKKRVIEQCNEANLIKLHEAYMKTEGTEMDETQLYDAFENILEISMSKEEFRILFKQMDSMRDKQITWDEFVSFLLLEYRVKDMKSAPTQRLELPLMQLPEIKNTKHRSAICKILFCPEIISSQNRKTSFNSGCYLTASRDGIINYWSLDFVYQRSVKSVNRNLRVQTTIVTDIIAMPDVQIICTSSAERDLRFYDTAAGKFELRIRITNLPDAVVCMNYYFPENLYEDCFIVLGDTKGSVKVIAFSPIDRGPFQQLPERDLLLVHYESLQKGQVDGLTVTEFNEIHSNWVNQVAYYGSLRGFISCSKCSKCSLFLSDALGTKMKYEFIVSMGIFCFTYCEAKQFLMTGGPDCLVRLWNPFVPKKPSAIFRGHRAPISSVVITENGELLYSLSKDRCIRAWNISSQICIKTYNSLPNELSQRMSVLYNSLTQKLIIASTIIAIVTCEKAIDEEISDGESHAGKITCVLFNPLFKVIVTTSTNSCIIFWDPWQGRCLHCVTNAHNKISLGDYVEIEITSAAFDFSYQLLVTGGRDGSLKVWSLSSGTCIKNMQIDTFSQSAITGIVWLKNRILCAGWNRYITEFADTETGIFRKSWEKRHTDDILCSAVCYPGTLVTASYNGELIFWKLDTGQAYKRFQVMDPTENYKIVHIKSKYEESKIKEEENNDKSQRRSTNESFSDESALGYTRTVPIRAVLFLCARKMDPSIGTLLVALDSGLVQVWSHHPRGGFIRAFHAIHIMRDCCMSLATDLNNEFLITGHVKGYIKVWLLKNYVVDGTVSKINMPALRLEFPFLWKDRIPGRTKRAVKDQSLPLLLSSFKGHSKPVNAVQFIPGARLIVSGSADHTVRLWTLGGRYIGTFGSFRNWTTLLPDVPAIEYLKNYRLPPEVKRIGSSTTIKVLKGGYFGANFDDGEEVEPTKEVPEHEKRLLYGERLAEPILGKYPDEVLCPKIEAKAPLDNSFAYIPVYCHLKTHDIIPIKK